LPDEELKRDSKLIGDCEKTIRAADGSLSIQAGLTDSIRDELRSDIDETALCGGADC
jgi:hypothetical protein